MKTHFIEATNGPQNWGKFMLGQFDEAEWQRRSAVDGGGLIGGRGWTRKHVLVLDLQTGEGAIFYPNHHGSPSADLEKHRIWVCPLFEPFLQWLYGLSDLEDLPPHVDLPDAPFSFAGYRRPGPEV